MTPAQLHFRTLKMDCEGGGRLHLFLPLPKVTSLNKSPFLLFTSNLSVLRFFLVLEQ